MFPLCYLVPQQATISINGATTYNFNLIVMDRIEDTNNEGLIDAYSTLVWDYRGLNNLNDVWNDTLSTLNDIISFVQRNEESNAFQIYDEVSINPFQDRFDNLLAGWSAQINIVMPNDKPACEITLN
jgi:ABC-type phosphate/phosphonate transport system ATPase subunit